MTAGQDSPKPAPAGKVPDAGTSPMEAQNNHMAHQSVPGPKDGVITGAEPSELGRHVEKDSARRD
ncbi:hypothetical protein [Aurantimonas sp. Leaf443]|uniref:hypothetical protein n=1 Tax=Aurantimonas sp. Leaf443 TaxID=1736378 RepID=UPI000B0101BC|nr:hypothetical protein [Aurantimonas sp. Leaf443]